MDSCVNAKKSYHAKTPRRKGFRCRSTAQGARICRAIAVYSLCVLAPLRDRNVRFQAPPTLPLIGGVFDRVSHAVRREAFQTQPARVALAAGGPGAPIGIVARSCQPVID